MRLKHSISLNIEVIKGLLVLILVTSLSSCVMEPSDLKINVVNRSNIRQYVGGIYNCDSCDIKRDVEIWHSLKKCEPQNMRLLSVKDKIQLRDKLLLDSIEIYSINADSLDKYESDGHLDEIFKKKWVKVLSGKVDMKIKTCTIIIE